MVGDGPGNALTAREAQCLRLVLELHTNDAIARELDLSTNTVRNHLKAARGKLGGLGRYDAARHFVRLCEGDGPNGTSARRTMVPGVDDGPPGIAGRSSGGLEEPSFHEVRAPFLHDDLPFGDFGRVTTPTERRNHQNVGRLLAIPAGAALIASLIIATPPMAESFSRLAVVVVPFFR